MRFPDKRREKGAGKSAIRLPFLFVLLMVFFVIVAGRLVLIQAVKADKLDGLALGQRLRSLELMPDRGTIYDRNGETMAMSVDMETIYATPYQVKKPRATATRPRLKT